MQRQSVTIDARLIRSGGIGTYVQTLLEDLNQSSSDRLWFALARKPDFATLKRFPSFRAVEVRSRVYFPTEQWAVPLATPRGSLLHVPHYNIPVAFSGPLVVTIHDLLHLEFPQFLKHRWTAYYSRALLHAAVTRARRIITGSHATMDSLVRRAGADPRKITVIPYRLSSRLMDADSAAGAGETKGVLKKDYFLYVGQIRPHKNLPGLISAFATFAAAHPNAGLVIVTYGDNDHFNVDDLAARHKAAANITLLRSVSFAALKALYENAVGVILPSFGEGFGLPVIEAMALGAPVIASDIEAIREAAGHAAVLVNPKEPAAIAEAMGNLYRSGPLREDLIHRGRLQARKFMDVPVGASTLRVYEEALG